MFPRWLTWLVLGFLLYLMVTGGVLNSNQQNAEPVKKPAASVQEDSKPQEDYPALKAATDIERWRKAINPDYAARTRCALDETSDLAPPGSLPFTWLDTEAGAGSPASCGAVILIKLTVWGPNGKPKYAGEIPFAIGARDLAAGIDAGLLGIRPGGSRTLVLPPSAQARAKKSAAPKALLEALPEGKLAIVSATRLE